MPRLSTVKRFVSKGGVRVYRIACQALPDLSGRVYLILGAGPPTLVDSGSGEGDSLKNVLDGLAAVRGEFGEPCCLREIQRIVVTHAHFDHIGGLAPLVRRTGATVAVHPLDRRVVEAWDERAAVHNLALDRFLRQAGVDEPLRSELVQKFGFNPGRVETVPVGLELHDGMNLDGLEFLHTPGHSAGHLCIRIDDLLLTGDHVLPHTVTQQWPESIAAWTGLGHYLDSLDRVQRLQGISVAMGGHEPPFADLAARCDEVRQSHFRRLDRLLNILASAEQPLTIAEMTEKMYSRQRGFHAILALMDVGSRIEHLEQRGRLAVVNYDRISDPDEPWRYSSTHRLP